MQAQKSAAQQQAQTATKYGPDGLPVLDAPGKKTAADGTGPATLRTIRLSASNPPMSVIFDLSKSGGVTTSASKAARGYSTVKC